MKFGVVYDLHSAADVANAGFDYIEGNASTLYRFVYSNPNGHANFRELKRLLNESGLKAEAFCCLFPSDIKLTGMTVDIDAISGYLQKLFPLLTELGAQVVVFGSGGARKVPEGFDRAKAWHQLIQIGRLIAEHSAKYGLSVALEPLYKKSCNIVNTQLEGLALVYDVDRSNFKLLSDLFHLDKSNEGLRELEKCGKALIHAHISNPAALYYPKFDDGQDYDTFFSGLYRAGYTGRLSYEGHLTNSETELAPMLSFLKAKASEHGL